MPQSSVPSRVVNLGDRRVRVRQSSDHDVFWDLVDRGRWEPETLAVVAGSIGPGDLMIDIGMWIGPITLLAAELGATVMGYEPDPEARRELQINIELNDFDDRVTVVPAALGASAGTGRLSSENLGDSSASLVRSGAPDGAEVEVRDAVTEALARRFSDAALIKIDVEGFEFTMVPRLAAELRRSGYRGSLLLSTHSYPTIERILRTLPDRLKGPTPLGRLGRRIVARVIVPILLAPGALRLALSLRWFQDRRWAQRNTGSWERFGTRDLVTALMVPRDREFWLQA